MTRPNWRMSATGPEQTVVRTDTDGRQWQLTLRQVGWIGQTGAFYSLDEDPSPTEPGSFAPLYFMPYGDRIVRDDQPAKRKAADIVIRTERQRGGMHGEERWSELRTIVLDGQEYDLPQESAVNSSTRARGPQLVTMTLIASDVRFEELPEIEPLIQVTVDDVPIGEVR